MFYATRAQQITNTLQEHQLMKFYAKADRDNFVLNLAGAQISAKEAHKLCIADVWQTHSADCVGVFFMARYVP